MKKQKLYTSLKSDFNEKENTIKHVISTNEVDRYNESLAPMGMSDENYKNNGQPVLWMHNSFSASDGPSKMVCGTSLYRAKESDKIIAKTRFLNTELGNDVRNFYKEGYLNSWSIGWKPLSEPQFKNGIAYFSKWELLEYSAVIIPANPGCVNLMFKDLKSTEMYNALSSEILLMEINESILENKKELLSLRSFIEEVKEFRNEFQNEFNKTKISLSEKIQSDFAGIAGEIKNLKEQRVKDLLDIVPQLVTGAISKFTGKAL
ncbi:hypothetical protein BH10BAC5_BH10BAC5_05990 [soil metagenome]